MLEDRKKDVTQSNTAESVNTTHSTVFAAKQEGMIQGNTAVGVTLPKVAVTLCIGSTDYSSYRIGVDDPV